MADTVQTESGLDPAVQPDSKQAAGQTAVQSNAAQKHATSKNLEKASAEQPESSGINTEQLESSDSSTEQLESSDSSTEQLESSDSSTEQPEPSDDPLAHIHVDAFPYMLDLAEAMLTSGADVHSVEQALVRMGKAYGAYQMNVLVITAVIIVTVALPGNFDKTLTRRIEGEGSTDFDRLEALSKLCDECCKDPMPARELRRKLDRIKGKKFPWISLYLGGALSAGGFAVFFGGSYLDGIMSALIALFVCFALKHFRPLTPNTIVFNFATSLSTGFIICLVARLVPNMSIDMAIIGVIMLLIPGVAMTNATRDMLSGDTISGVMRFIESLLWATSLALGFMAALWLASFVN